MNRSETIGELAAALAKAQGQMANASKSAANPFFKSSYADLSSIVDAIKEPLASNGIAYVQTTDTNEGGVIVETTLLHASGEWLSSQLRMRPVKDDPQGIGSCISYARRYALQAIVGLAAEDDDGNAASGNGHKEAQRPVQQPKPEPVKAAPVEVKKAATPVTTPSEDKDRRKQLITQITADRQLLKQTVQALNGDAMKRDGVGNWEEASLPYLEDLADRMARQVKLTQATPAEGGD